MIMANHKEHRLRLIQGGALARRTKCPYPECVLDLEHDGEHDPRGTKPRGTIRYIQAIGQYAVMPISCEVCAKPTYRRGGALWMDEFNNGWILCAPCSYSLPKVEPDANQ